MLAKILDWKLWVVIGSILSVIFIGLKIRGDHYKDKVKESEDALVSAEAEGSIKEFEAVQEVRQTAAQKEIAKLKETQDAIDTDDVITTAVR